MQTDWREDGRPEGGCREDKVGGYQRGQGREVSNRREVLGKEASRYREFGEGTRKKQAGLGEDKEGAKRHNNDKTR